MRIAQVAPLYERVPPRLYGGTERVVFWLTEALLRRGHDVTLFASGDSRSRARLVAPVDRAIRLDMAQADPISLHLLQLAQVAEYSADFDVIHCHVDYLAYPFGRLLRPPVMHTVHGRLDLPHLRPVYQYFRDVPLVSISDAQRQPMRDLNLRWLSTIHHGLPLDEYPYSPRGGSYLAYLGRIAREKRPDLAIEVAKRTGVPLKIAAKVDPVDQGYFDREIAPLLDHPLIEFLGEIDDRAKPEFLGGARALLFPIDWPEPFGLVVIEALACGTPVIARARGAAPEVILRGRTGFLANTLEELVHAVKSVDGIDRMACRQDAEARFSVDRMASEYEAVYGRLAAPAEAA